MIKMYSNIGREQASVRLMPIKFVSYCLIYYVLTSIISNSTNETINMFKPLSGSNVGDV